MTLHWLTTYIASAALLYASYRDFKTREVDDIVWIIPSCLGLLINLYGFYVNGFSNVWIYLIGVAVTGALAFAIYLAGLYGGADAKALLMISLVDPFVPAPYRIHGLMGLTTFTNGMILSASLPILLALWNVRKIISGEKIFNGFEDEPLRRKIAAFFLGTRLADASRKRFWSLIEERKNDKRRFRFSISLDDFTESGYDDAWVTPGIPLIIFFTAGYFVAVFLGDLTALILASLFPSPQPILL
ncbi:MAG TPA: A24 family peptidase [Candidatus Caldiarchaeum subterraneum]|uniref:A24 family peptidase n=1 Tax=Caldiarchaeum subterraneum TaxID=311458 RepID=A0A832ZUS4_CALS0|nr:A24 family peptidase [Candidatus Caldarchaeum subterraneum]